MGQRFLSVAGAAGLALAFITFTQARSPSDADSTALAADKAGICHATGSPKNPFVFITVSSNALDAHLKHGDFVAASAAACQGPGPTATIAGTPTITLTPQLTQTASPTGAATSTVTATVPITTGTATSVATGTATGTPSTPTTTATTTATATTTRTPTPTPAP